MKKVSIILPTYNGAKFIVQAIESVQAQVYADWELIIVSDGSVDDTEAVVKQYSAADERIIFIQNEKNLGIQKTLNRGLKHGQGTYVARIDDDDQWSDPEKLARQISFLETHPEYALVGTGGIIVDERNIEFTRYLMPDTDTAIRKKILSKNCFLHASVVFRKDIALQCGGYPESPETKHIEDHDLWLQMGMLGKLENLPVYAVTLMERAGGLSAQNRVVQAQHMLAEAIRFKNKYPNFLKGYLTSRMRLLFFQLYRYVPFRKHIIAFAKRAYKK